MMTIIIMEYNLTYLVHSMHAFSEQVSMDGRIKKVHKQEWCRDNRQNASQFVTNLIMQYDQHNFIVVPV